MRGVPSIIAAMLLAALAPPAMADVSIGVGLSVTGQSEVKLSRYECPGHDPLTVQYLDAAPNFLALLPVGGQNLIFVHVVAAGGAKYVSGQYVWWDKGSDATLIDVTEGLDAAPVLSCTAQDDTP